MSTLIINLRLKNIGEDEPANSEASEKSADEAHKGIERAKRVTSIEARRKDVICQEYQPFICITESLPNSIEITDRMGSAIHCDREEAECQYPS